MVNTDALLGRWSIVSWEQCYDDGRVQLPMGAAPEGFIDYSAQGDMVCMISRADRAGFVKGGQWDAPDDEKAQAYNSMLAYGGRYRLEGGTVVHTVDFSLFPNWKGGEQKRELEFRDDGTIALLARLEQGTPQARVARLVWRRRSDNENRELK